MKVERTADAVFTAEFESEDELREEHRLNLAHGALRLATSESVPLHTTLLVTLRGPQGGEAHVRATAVAKLPDGIALAVDGNPDEIVQRLLPGHVNLSAAKDLELRNAGPPSPAAEHPEILRGAQDDGAALDEEKSQNTWDRVRSLPQMQKLLLAVKADRSERATLLQDNDPRVLLSLLRNPRLTVDEVARMAKSTFLNFQIADVIMKTSQWSANLDVRQALIHNPKTPQPLALRILPTLPEADIRAIARAGTNMALKQAALRRLQGK